MKALSISNLCKTYKGGVIAVDGISFSVDRGDFFALLGPNGAGKTTTIGIVTSLVNKTSGEIKVFGKDLDKNRDECKASIGLVPQEFNFNIFEKCLDILIQQAGYYGIGRELAKKKAEELLEKLDLLEKRNAPAGTLSGGMKRKLMIARALVHSPKLLILDEPTAGVDVETRREMWDFLEELNREGTTIILTTHYLEEAEHLCKNIAIIHKGKLIENTSMKDLISRLHLETFILDTRKPVKTLKKLKGYFIEKIDEKTLKAEITKKQNINDLINHLTKQKIEIVSMRNKANRLEELFIQITKK